MIIFAYDAVAHNPSFAAGLIDPPAAVASLVPGKRAQYTSIDAAFECGRTAALASDFSDVLAPSHFSPAEVAAFNEGAIAGWREAEFVDISAPEDWDTDMEGVALEVEMMAAEREAMWALERGYFHA